MIATILQTYKSQLVETILAIILWFVIRLLLNHFIRKRFLFTQFSVARKNTAFKSSVRLLNIVVVAALIIIWSIEQSRIILFLSSALTVLGVAFFAQWSHLSNITSGIILFFNSTTKIGDHIRILDKEFDIEGYIVEIGPFFVKIKTTNGELTSLPNNVLMQKAVKATSPVTASKEPVKTENQEINPKPNEANSN